MKTDDPYYKIAWTGDNEISVVCVQWFDLADYKFASHEDFPQEEDAANHARYLAHEHDVSLSADVGNKHRYLD